MPEITNFTLLLIISIFHFYWAFGGQLGTDRVFPKIKNKPNTLPPRPITILAGLIFLSFGCIYLNNQLQIIQIPNKTIILILGIIFTIRAIGEFKYIGFTKRVYNSKFATMDTKFYSPLCLLLAINSLYIYFYN